MPDWNTYQLQVNVGLSDGRIGPAAGSLFEHGLRRRRRAGYRPWCRSTGLSDVPEPFRTWTAEFRGTAVETTVEALIAGEAEGPREETEFKVEETMAVPPCSQGTLFPEAAEMLAHSVEGKLMGGPRFELLFRANGAVRVAGRTSRSLVVDCESDAKVSVTLPNSG